MNPDDFEDRTPEDIAESERRISQDERYQAVLSEREVKEIDFCCCYFDSFNHGTDGHLLRVVIAKLANLLQQSEPYGGREYVRPLERNDEQEPEHD